MYIYSPSLHKELHQKLIKCFSNYIPINIIPNILNEEYIDLVNSEISINKDFEISDTEMKLSEPIEELKYPQEWEDGGITISDELNEKKCWIFGCKLCLNALITKIYLFS